MNYKDAGVDTEKAGKLIKDLKKSIVSTHENLAAGKVADRFGSFAGEFVPEAAFRGQNIVATTDGVGTKIDVSRRFNHLDNLGYDLVGMCVNDLYCAGATPAFFLDYIACGKLDDSWYQPLMQSIVNACKEAGMALLGGETAEHPGVMKDDEFDLAGFCVGFNDPARALPMIEKMSAGDSLIALPSNGLHSNGFSLVRKILKKIEEEDNDRYRSLIQDRQFITEQLLAPTRIYSYFDRLLKVPGLKAAAHITGGGMYENLPRILPAGFDAMVYDPVAFKMPIYDFILEFVSLKDALYTFNMGSGMILLAESSSLDEITAVEPQAVAIGELIAKKSDSEKDPAVLVKGIDI